MALCVVDHLIVAVPDSLDECVRRFSELTGVEPVVGGKHHGKGTQNVLFRLDGGAYFEVMCPDPDQPNPPNPWMAIDQVKARQERVLSWAVRPAAEGDIDHVREQVRKASGLDLGEVLGFSRATPAGDTISWQLTYNQGPPAPGVSVVPFVIAWGTSMARLPHKTAPAGCALASVRVGHPDPAYRSAVAAMGLASVVVVESDQPLLEFELDTPKGRVVVT